MERGLQALGRAREEEGGDGEGVREFSALVLKIVESREGEGDGDGEGRDGREVVWREEVEESVRIVERLLRREV